MYSFFTSYDYSIISVYVKLQYGSWLGNKQGKYQSTKLFDGYSTCFRQWKATHSHCQFLHGYSLEFRVIFQGKLDEKNWVCDFGCFKKNGVKQFLKDTFDHTTIVSKDDPYLDYFIELDKKEVIVIRILDAVGCEYFAEFVFKQLSLLIQQDPTIKDRVSIHSVECIENKRNSAIYGE